MLSRHEVTTAFQRFVGRDPNGSVELELHREFETAAALRSYLFHTDEAKAYRDRDGIVLSEAFLRDAEITRQEIARLQRDYCATV